MREQKVVVVRPGDVAEDKRKLRYFEGINAGSAGTRQIAMQRLVIPPGARAEPHAHDGYETAIYVLEGRVQTFYGAGLLQSVINQAGEFLFLPPEVPHQPVNLSSREVAVALIARSIADDVEPVTPYLEDARPRRASIERLYINVCTHSLDDMLAAMTADVRWPSALAVAEGKAQVRACWLSEWERHDVIVEPSQFSLEPDGRLAVTVKQTISDLDGNVLLRERVQHVYTFSDGLIQAMERRSAF